MLSRCMGVLLLWPVVMSKAQVFSHVLRCASHHPTVFAGASLENGILLVFGGGRPADQKENVYHADVGGSISLAEKL